MSNKSINIEIERKFLISEINHELLNEMNKYIRINKYNPIEISQYYILKDGKNINRVRKMKNIITNDVEYICSFKFNKEKNIKNEVEFPISKNIYYILSSFGKGNMIQKVRYKIPIKDNLLLELDMFKGKLNGLIIAEIEYPNIEMFNSFKPPMFLRYSNTCNDIVDISDCSRYSNKNLIYEDTYPFI